MRWQQIQQEIDLRLPNLPPLDRSRPLILVDCTKQRLYRLSSDDLSNSRYTVSTAKNGIGNQQDSYQTPLGVHRIEQKIGAEQPFGMVFQARQAIGKIANDLDNQQQDEITSRILWLSGLEPSVNLGGQCDTFSRYIYIHGTSDEKRIGRAVSAGCIRMKNADIVELFDNLQVDDLVLIR